VRNALAEHYPNLNARERLRATLEALGQGDVDEANRLRETCPRRTYTTLEHDFDAAAEVVLKLTLATCVGLTQSLAELAMLRVMSGRAVPLCVLSAIEGTTVRPDNSSNKDSHDGADPAAEAQTSPASNDDRSPEMDPEFVDLTFEATCPLARQELTGFVKTKTRRLLTEVGSILDGYGRFTQHMLGMEAIEVIGAWMPQVAVRLRKLDLDDLPMDEGMSRTCDEVARAYWKKLVG
jgi:hypothetical protein